MSVFFGKVYGNNSYDRLIGGSQAPPQYCSDKPENLMKLGGAHWSQVKLVSKLSKWVWEETERKTGHNLAVCLEREQLLAFAWVFAVF